MSNVILPASMLFGLFGLPVLCYKFLGKFEKKDSIISFYVITSAIFVGILFQSIVHQLVFLSGKSLTFAGILSDMISTFYFLPLPPIFVFTIPFIIPFLCIAVFINTKILKISFKQSLWVALRVLGVVAVYCIILFILLIIGKEFFEGQQMRKLII